MRLYFSDFKKKFWLFGIALGALLATTITLIATVWEWVENPSGIFHGNTGTNWGFVSETAISWFVPIFIYAAVIASIAHLSWSFVRRAWQAYRQR